MRVIINADDFGEDHETNDAIWELAASGMITSATIMANGNAVDDAIGRARSIRKISFGVHLNITQYAPLTPGDGLRWILDEMGNFSGYRKLPNVFCNRSLSSAIYVEFCAQVEKLMNAGIRVSHVDSHQHIHTRPSIFPLIKRLQRKYGLKKVRLSRNIFEPGYRVSALLRFKKKLFNQALRSCYPTRTTDGFCNAVQFCGNMGKISLRQKSVEIMVHPGKAGDRYDMDLLRASFGNASQGGYELINYHQL